MLGIHCCKDCKDRKVGCYIDCEIYKEAKEKHTEECIEKKKFDDFHKPIQKGRFLGDYSISKSFKKKTID